MLMTRYIAIHTDQPKVNKQYLNYKAISAISCCRNRRNKNLLLRGGQRAAGEKTTESDDVTLIQDISKNCQEEDEVGDMREADRLQRECADVC